MFLIIGQATVAWLDVETEAAHLAVPIELVPVAHVAPEMLQKYVALKCQISL